MPLHAMEPRGIGSSLHPHRTLKREDREGGSPKKKNRKAPETDDSSARMLHVRDVEGAAIGSGLPLVHASCSSVRCSVMSSSISWWCIDDGSSDNGTYGTRSHISDSFVTNTTSDLRVASRLPTTIWCPYRSIACRAFGIRIVGSVSS